MHPLAPSPRLGYRYRSTSPAITKKENTMLRSALVAAVLALSASAQAAMVTDCSPNGLCYCIEDGFKPLIAKNLANLRAIIAEERGRGKAIGYQSLPLSTLGGGFFNINRDVGAHTKKRVEARFGANQTYLLAPGSKEAEIPDFNGQRAGGGEYMVMWTALLEGANGMGDDFDYVYFVGPSDFAAALGLTGQNDMERINQIYIERLISDPEFKSAVERRRVTPQSFRNYYALKAGVNVSLGAHDEWVIFKTINDKRRASKAYGTGNQIPMWFDGRGTSPAESETSTSNGYIGACPAK